MHDSAARLQVLLWIDSANVLVDLVRALAWPAVVLVVFLSLRQPLKDKFTELLSLKGGGVEATFQIQPQATEKLAKELEEPAKALAGEASTTPEMRRGEIGDLIKHAVQLGFAAAGGIGTPETIVAWKDGGPDIRVLNSEEGRGGRWEVYMDRAGKFRWRLKTAAGQVVATGEGYETQAAAIAGIESVRRAASGGISDN